MINRVGLGLLALTVLSVGPWAVIERNRVVRVHERPFIFEDYWHYAFVLPPEEQDEELLAVGGGNPLVVWVRLEEYMSGSTGVQLQASHKLKPDTLMPGYLNPDILLKEGL